MLATFRFRNCHVSLAAGRLVSSLITCHTGTVVTVGTPAMPHHCVLYNVDLSRQPARATEPFEHALLFAAPRCPPRAPRAGGPLHSLAAW